MALYRNLVVLAWSMSGFGLPAAGPIDKSAVDRYNTRRPFNRESSQAWSTTCAGRGHRAIGRYRFGEHRLYWPRHRGHRHRPDPGSDRSGPEGPDLFLTASWAGPCSGSLAGNATRRSASVPSALRPCRSAISAPPALHNKGDRPQR